jgi:TusA-related sulfurtransferase
MPAFVIDQWVDARSLDHDDAIRSTTNALRGLAAGQIAEVMVTDAAAASDIFAWPETRPLDVLDAMVLCDACRLIIRHR